jgi:hypothetical protein
MADRIQARAIHRCGELLDEIKSTAGRPPKEIRDGAFPNYGRTEVATRTGLSERQRETALRVARVPDEEFEEAIESRSPPR